MLSSLTLASRKENVCPPKLIVALPTLVQVLIVALIVIFVFLPLKALTREAQIVSQTDHLSNNLRIWTVLHTHDCGAVCDVFNQALSGALSLPAPGGTSAASS
jgi:hypothetical protein